MYVNPFLFGVITTVVAEVIIFTVSVFIFTAKENKRRKDWIKELEKSSENIRKEDK